MIFKQKQQLNKQPDRNAYNYTRASLLIKMKEKLGHIKISIYICLSLIIK